MLFTLEFAENALKMWFLKPPTGQGFLNMLCAEW